MTAIPTEKELLEKAEKLGRYGQELMSWRYSWLSTARPKQLPPPGDWDVWACIAGRGWGKTRVGAETVGGWAVETSRSRWAVVAPTQNDCRSVCFEGESGLLEKIPSYFIQDYNRSLLELTLKNGSIFIGRSAEKPDRLRGPQFHGAWCDELASWGAAVAGAKSQNEQARLQDTWDNLRFGLRLGRHPRILVTTTPRPLQFLRDLVKDPTTRVSTGSTFENKKHLAGNALNAFQRVYSGTSKGAQELYAKILDEVEGALWSHALIEKTRVAIHPELTRIVVAVDPAVTSEANSDEWGIVVAGLGVDGDIYVLDDVSAILKPHLAASRVLAMYDRYEADHVVVETNQGGDLVEHTLRSVDRDRYFALKKVHAKRGKYLRAEPVAAYYEQGKVHHVGMFPALEEQMTRFVGSTDKGSPDRLDALVYAISELMSGHLSYDLY